MSLGTMTLVDKVASVGPVKHLRVSVVGDGAYVAGGSTGFLAKLRALLGEKCNIINAREDGVNVNGGVSQDFEYTPRGPLLDVASIAATGDLVTTKTVHGLSAGDVVRLFKKEPHNANDPDVVSAPTPLALDTTYFVIAGGLTTTAFKLSLTSGGAAIDITADALGDFQVQKEDKLLVRVATTGVESADADQSDTTYSLYVVTY